MIICNEPCYYEENGMGGLDFFMHLEKIGLYKGKLIGSLNIISEGIFYPGNTILLDLLETINTLKCKISNLKVEAVPDIGDASFWDVFDFSIIYDGGGTYDLGIIDLSFDKLELYLGYDGEFERVFIFPEGRRSMMTLVEKRLRKGSLEKLILALPDFDLNDKDLPIIQSE